MKISENTTVNMPIKNLISIVIAVAVGVWAYFGVVETLKDIVIKLKDKYNITKIIGHYEVDDVKKCPSFDVKEWREKNVA